jgi:hypothetical protein
MGSGKEGPLRSMPLFAGGEKQIEHGPFFFGVG